jgi:hypothetical protein
MKTFVLYQCGFCNRKYRVEKNCIKHEEICYLNPKSRSCKTCIHHIFVGDKCNLGLSCTYGLSEDCDGINQDCETYGVQVRDCESWEKGEFIKCKKCGFKFANEELCEACEVDYLDKLKRENCYI